MIAYDKTAPLRRALGESLAASLALQDYAAMGIDRSLRKLLERYIQQSSNEGQTKNPPTTKWTTIATWSDRYEWVDRCRAYDAALDARARAATEQEAIERRRQMIETHAIQARDLGTIAQRLTVEFNRRYDEKGTLQWISGEDFIKMVAQLPKILEIAQKLERLAAGEATERHEHMLTIDQVAGMGIEELEAYMKENNIPL